MSLAHMRYKLTYEDYVQLSEDKRGELIDGYFVVSPSPSSRHQSVSGKIEYQLGQWIEKFPLGELLHAPMDVKLSEHDTFQPDILFIDKNRVDIIKEKYILGTPDFIIEILSPSNKQLDLLDKLTAYSHFEVREYWIVDPIEETIRVYELKESGLEMRQVYEKGSKVPSSVLQEFQLDTSKVF